MPTDKIQLSISGVWEEVECEDSKISIANVWEDLDCDDLAISIAGVWQTIDASDEDVCCGGPTGSGFIFNDAATPDTIAKDSSIQVYVTDGCPPFTWDTDSTGYSFTEATTTSGENTLNCADGTCGNEYAPVCGIQVTDVCLTTIGFSIDNDDAVDTSRDRERIASCRITNSSDISWVDVHTASSGTFSESGSNFGVGKEVDWYGPGQHLWLCVRFWSYWNVGPISDEAIIRSVTLRCNYSVVTPNYSNTIVTKATGGITCEVGDYSQFENVPFSDVMNVSGGGIIDYVFNAAGIAYVQSLIDHPTDPYVTLMIREYDSDYLGVEPTVGYDIGLGTSAPWLLIDYDECP
jgi:hypothetical protein